MVLVAALAPRPGTLTVGVLAYRTPSLSVGLFPETGPLVVVLFVSTGQCRTGRGRTSTGRHENPPRASAGCPPPGLGNNLVASLHRAEGRKRGRLCVKPGGGGVCRTAQER